jgi:hypothetical protein
LNALTSQLNTNTLALLFRKAVFEPWVILVARMTICVTACSVLSANHNYEIENVFLDKSFTQPVFRRHITLGSLSNNQYTRVYELHCGTFNLFCGLVKYDYLALNETSLDGFTTVDFCCSRGVTALALTTLEKTLGSCQ